ncbi:MAG TPA: porin family protein [Gemmatimonadales bacterium]|nr:porin family protein [Gemmatimonadales bacterium]
MPRENRGHTWKIRGRAAFAVAVLALAPCRVACGQAILVLLFGDKFASENFQGGIKIDLAWSTLAGLPDAERLRSFAVGGFLELRLGSRFSIQPEFTFKSPAGARGLPFTPTGNARLDSAFAGASAVSVARTLGYITIPILAKVTFGPLRLGVGPQLGYIVKAFDHYTGTVSREDDLSYDLSLWSRVNRWDAGVNVLAEYALSQRRGLQSLRVRASWYRAFGDALKDAPGQNDVLTVGIGVPIGGPKAAAK